MVMVDTTASAVEWQSRLRAEKVMAFAVASNRMRLVFHADVDDEKLEIAIEAFRRLAENWEPVAVS